MRRRLRTTALLAIVAASALVPGSAGAHDHRLPRLLLEHGDQHQRGINYHHWWTASTAAGECVGWDAIGPRAFPDQAVEEPDPKAVIRLMKRQQPSDVVLKAWQLRGPDGQPVGEGVPVETNVRKVRGAETRQWAVVFDPPFVGDNFLQLRIEWDDTQGCGGAQGGFWGFHLFSESL